MNMPSSAKSLRQASLLLCPVCQKALRAAHGYGEEQGVRGLEVGL